MLFRSPYALIDAQAAQSPTGANGLIFLPYLMGERAPRWNPDASGAFLGITAAATRGDLIRSVLEGVAMNLSIVLDILRAHVAIDEIVVIGGGAKGPLWRQIMADIYQTRVVVPTLLEEAGAMGAAVIGGVGAGLFQDFTAIDRFLSFSSSCVPNPDTAAGYARLRLRFEHCYQALESTYPLFR